MFVRCDLVFCCCCRCRCIVAAFSDFVVCLFILGCALSKQASVCVCSFFSFRFERSVKHRRCVTCPVSLSLSLSHFAVISFSQWKWFYSTTQNRKRGNHFAKLFPSTMKNDVSKMYDSKNGPDPPKWNPEHTSSSKMYANVCIWDLCICCICLIRCRASTDKFCLCGEASHASDPKCIDIHTLRPQSAFTNYRS